MLAGFWPSCPHPTLFPGGQGSVAPSYELPSGTFTFYYLELALEAKLQRKVKLKHFRPQRLCLHCLVYVGQPSERDPEQIQGTDPVRLEKCSVHSEQGTVHRLEKIYGRT